MNEVETKAREANSVDRWNGIWAEEGTESWRGKALEPVYARIAQLVPKGAHVADLGGGAGILAQRLYTEREAEVEVWEQSAAARALVPVGIDTHDIDLERFRETFPHSRFVNGVDEHGLGVVVATEVLEHLSVGAREEILDFVEGMLSVSAGSLAIFSVPNDRLGPDEEPQHTIRWTALEFLTFLRARFGALARVEVYGPYLLGVVGEPKGYTLSVTLPVRDEAVDLERTLASFRGVADEIVVGVDPRTTDASREIARKYAEVVFDLVEPRGVGEDQVMSVDGVHFSWLRNQCVERCSSEWIFMTEGHEELHEGQDALLGLQQLVPQGVQVIWVLRTGQGQQWGYPWLFRRDGGFRYKRATHNELQFPESAAQLVLPVVKTLHFRDHHRELVRREQRRYHNRITLLGDWMKNQSPQSLFYLASEEREHSPEKAIAYLREFLDLKRRNGPMRYHARLILAKTLAIQGDREGAREVLMAATADDWNRSEHWMYLGDLAFEQEHFEEAYEYYRHAAIRIGRVPFTVWWIDLAAYSYLPAIRLAQTCGELGRGEEALYWAKKVRDLLPKDAPEVAFEEALANIALLEDAINGQPEPPDAQ